MAYDMNTAYQAPQRRPLQSPTSPTAAYGGYNAGQATGGYGYDGYAEGGYSNQPYVDPYAGTNGQYAQQPRQPAQAPAQAHRPPARPNQNGYDRPPPSRNYGDPRARNGYPEHAPSNGGPQTRRRDNSNGRAVIPGRGTPGPDPRTKARPPPSNQDWDRARRPDFPTQKTWNGQYPPPRKPESKSLDDSMAGMSLTNNAYNREPYPRPQTADNRRPNKPYRNYNNVAEGGYADGYGNGPGNVEYPSRPPERAQPGAPKYAQDPRDRSYSQTGRQRPPQPQPQPQPGYAPQQPQYDGRFRQAHTTPASPTKPPPDFVPPRSMTMPNGYGDHAANGEARPKYPGQAKWQEPGPGPSYHGPEETEFIPARPATANGSRPAAPQLHTDEAPHHDPNDYAPEPVHAPAGQERPLSLGVFLDSYYNLPHEPYPFTGHYQELPIDEVDEADEDMPNFDAVSEQASNHRRGMTIDQHLKPQNEAVPDVPPLPDLSSYQTHKSRSQPNLREQGQGGMPNGRSPYGLSIDVPDVPPMPVQPNGNFGPQSYQNVQSPYGEVPGRSSMDRQNQGYYPANGQQQPTPIDPRRYDSNAQRSNSDKSSRLARTPISPGTQNGFGVSPSTTRPLNPDALPEHPTPIRPGLMTGSVVNQPEKAPPVRQYGTNNPPQQNGQAPMPDRHASVAVTPQELEQLKQAMRKSPSDLKVQMKLVKKWEEAATVLADEGGRADPKTRNKNRERYILDSHKLLKKLVHSGYPDAMFYLADCLGRGGLGLENDPKEAFTLYQSAAKAGHAQSAYRTAVCCELGQEEGGGTRKDPVKAVQWYKRAAALGDTPAMYKMGMILLKGLLGQPRDSQEAVTWLKRAAERADEENPHALHELALLYENAGPNDGIIRDDQYSLQLFTQAANLGYKFSQFRLGCAFEYGHMGCPIDPRQSIMWYSRAAVNEEHQSELALSGWYLTGSEGVLGQSDTEAYLWARKAAMAGLAKAEYAMGYFTEVGIGAPANLEDAKRWYWRAASKHFPKAKERLEDLQRNGSKVQKSRERLSRSNVNKQHEGDCVVM
ncbi:MAG: hypothetical protein M1819_004121 [Sarea resinae]|nr:MAG: hypothetical protein M1819_004121 [Sarea resinae]